MVIRIQISRQESKFSQLVILDFLMYFLAGNFNSPWHHAFLKNQG
jgi:hypothetical protein